MLFKLKRKRAFVFLVGFRVLRRIPNAKESDFICLFFLMKFKKRLFVIGLHVLWPVLYRKAEKQKQVNNLARITKINIARRNLTLVMAVEPRNDYRTICT